jgi:GT2 family glycosyltransferase
MRTSGIVVTYNSEREIAECLTALGAAGVDESIVVDNASADRSFQTAASLATVTVPLDHNVGFGAGVNRGASEASGDVLVLVNPDCQVTRPCMERLVEALEDEPRLAAVVPKMIYPDGRPGVAGGFGPSLLKEVIGHYRLDALVPSRVIILLARLPKPRWLRALTSHAAVVVPREPLSRVDWVSGWCMAIRSEAFRRVGGFDEEFFLYFEDVDLCTRLRAAGYGVAIAGDVFAVHEESTSTSRVGKSRVMADGMLRYFRKHGRWYQRLMAPVVAQLMR